jgi:uncharacterized membrane protein
MKPRTCSRVIARGLRDFAFAAVGPLGMATLVARSGASGKGLRTALPRYIEAMDQDATLFEAVIVPYRSLSQRGLAILMAAIGLLCVMGAVRFWLIGAWPVAGFAVAEIGLAICLLRLNASRARASELVLLSEQTLHIVRTDWRGRRDERVLPVGWLNAVMDEPPGQVPRLLLVTHGVREEIAAALGEVEKRDLWAALSEALRRLRNPSFENPQLRD